MGRRLSLWCPNWAITAWKRRYPGAAPADGVPFALIHAQKGVRKLFAVDEAGLAEGLYAGQKATDAAALSPDLVTAEAEPEADAAALTALAHWCVRFSPAVAADAPDGLIIDITGLAHLWGGEEALVADLLRRLAANGIPARAAVADTAGAAWGLARFSRTAIAPPQDQGPLLAPLPVQALRLSDKAAAQLPRLGVATIGGLMGLPRAQLTRRFGAEVVLRLDRILNLL
jgi:protein ImuB